MMFETSEPTGILKPISKDGKTVTDSRGEYVGVSGKGFKPQPVFDEQGRLIGFSRNVSS